MYTTTPPFHSDFHIKGDWGPISLVNDDDSIHYVIIQLDLSSYG